MKLQSKKARVPIAALGVTALIAGAGALTSPAFAGTVITMNSTSATSANLLDVGYDIAAGSFTTAALAKATYGVKVTSINDVLKVSLDSYTAVGATTPSAVTGVLHYLASASDTPTAAGWTAMDSSATLPVLSSTSFSTNVSPTPYLYFAPDVAGTYKVHLVDTQGTGATDDDIVGPTITLTVKDISGLAPTTDDWAPTVSNSVTSAGIGAPITTTVDLSGLTLTDGRGTSSGKGVLGDGVAALTGVSFAGAGLAATAYTGVTNPGGTLLLAVNQTSIAGTLVATARFDNTGNGLAVGDLLLGTASTTITSNGVTAVPGLAVTPVTGSVLTSTGAATIKPGTAAATYTVSANNVVTPVSGATVYFTLTSGVNTPVLTADGTLISSATGSKIYSAVTNSLGVASLTVTSATTTALTTYTVSAASNGVAGSAPVSVLATYTAPAATTFVSDNTAAELTPTPVAGISVTLKGKVIDQFGASFTPAASGTQTVTVSVPAGTTLCNSVITAGAFSCVYTPATLPVAGTQTTYRYVYAGATTYDGNISWSSSVAAATVVLTSPNATVAGANLSDHTTISPGQSSATTGLGAGVDADDFGDAAGQVTGTVADAANAPLAFKAVTLTGGSGVYFSTAATPGATTVDDLKTSITVVTNASGVFSGGYAFFTKSGTVKVTATSGSVKDEASVTTDASSDPYKVTVNDVAGTPGSTLIVTGTIKDAFGNGVPDSDASLSIGTSTLGSFGDSTPTTNAAGVFSTTFTSGSNQSGSADLVATLVGQTANAVPVVGWLANAGLTITHGEYRDQATLTVTALKLTLSATGRLNGGGRARLSGNFVANTGVDIYSKALGESSYKLLDSVETDADGDYGASYVIKKTTRFLAKSAGLSSKVRTTYVYSTVTLTGKSYSHNRATLRANGAPNAKGTLTFYRKVSGRDPKLGSIISNSDGKGTITVTLPRGVRSVYVVFRAPGTFAGTSTTVKIRVK